MTDEEAMNKAEEDGLQPPDGLQWTQAAHNSQHLIQPSQQYHRGKPTGGSSGLIRGDLCKTDQKFLGTPS